MYTSTMLTTLADVTSAATVMHAYVTPVVRTLGTVASLACTFFLVQGGFHYMTSTGNPERLEHAKRIIRNALIGLVMVLAATTITAILSHAYSSAQAPISPHLPTLSSMQPVAASSGLVGVLLKAIGGVLDNIIQTAATPFLKALTYFTTATPLIADNSSVFNLWLAIVSMSDVMLVLVVALLGLHVMSYASLGFEEIEFKHLLPQIGLIFLLMNTSVFLIDGLISLSNAMIHALQSGFASTSVWQVLSDVATQANAFGLAALLIMIAFLIFAVILLVYYVGRIVTLYIGAVLSPLILLVWLIPGFRDFAENAAKTYVATIFVLFVHVVILELVAALFAGMMVTSPNHLVDPLMSMIVGLAALIALIKTQGVMMQLSYASVGPRTARKLGSQLMTGVSYLTGNRRKMEVNATNTQHTTINNNRYPPKRSVFYKSQTSYVNHTREGAS